MLRMLRSVAVGLVVLLLPVAAAELVVESVALVGSSPLPRLDPTAISFPAAEADDSMVLCSANGTIMRSVDGGSSWSPPGSHEVRGFAPENAIGTDTQRAIAGTSIPAGYIKGEGSAGTPWTFPKTSTSVETVTVDRAAKTFNFSLDSRPDWQTTWDAPPRGSMILFSPGSGGAVAMDDTGNNFIATPWVWYGNAPLPKTAGAMCCNGSVVAYVTADGGKTWKFRSEIASKQSIIAAGFASEEGPNENDVVRLKDGSLLVVMRKDGGDGVPHHAHVPYLFASSSDQGHSWKIQEAPNSLLSARPRAVSLANGATFIAGGRPALNLWVSADPSEGSSLTGAWKKFDIPTEHNKRISDPSLKFCTAFENATLALGWAESSAYTQVLPLSADSALICYERQGSGSGGYRKHAPPDCAPTGSAIFCMRVRMAATSDTTEPASMAP